MVLRAGYIVVAQKIQEAVLALSHSDIRTRIADALADASRGTDSWSYLVDIFGDDTSGDVVYSMDGDLRKCSYTISGADCKLDTVNSVDVLPVTTYVTQNEESVAAREAGARNSKNDMKQLQMIHDSSAKLGAACAVKEAAKVVSRETLRLTESACDFLTEIPLSEAIRTSYPIKVISPGTGSTAHYPAAVLERDGPKLVKAGTLMFWNHPTRAQEAARPEGDLNDLAAILTKDAVYQHDGPKGPGLYAEAKVMGDYAERVASRAPHIGLSIRAGGISSGETINGQPVLKELTYIESVDYVTKAGRGGLALAEAAREAGLLIKEEITMTVEETQKLIEAGVAAGVKPFREAALKAEASALASRLLETLNWPATAKNYVIDRCIKDLPVQEGALDSEAFQTRVVAESKSAAGVFAEMSGAGRVTGMGAGPGLFAIPMTEAQRAAEAVAEAAGVEQSKRVREASTQAFSRLMGGNRKAAELAAGKVA